MKRAKNPVNAVARSIEILEALKERDGAGVTELASLFDISKGAVHNHLATLEQHGYVDHEGDTYRVGLQFVIMGEYARNQSVLFVNGKEPVDELARTTGEYAHLSTQRNGRGIKLYKARGRRAVGSDYQRKKLQNPEHLHYTATGKAILAFLPREEVDEIVDEYGLSARTDRTITDRERLYRELDEISDRGFSLNDEEEVEGIRAVGAPICDRDERALGAVSISAPTARLPDEVFEDEIPREVMQTANVVEANINMAVHSGDISEFR